MAEESIEIIIEKYKNMVYGISLTQLGNRFDADEVFQDVFLTYHRKQKVFQEEEHEKAWLIRVTLNFCKKHRLSIWKKRMIPMEMESVGGSFQFQLPEENDIYGTMQELPDKYRLVLYLYYFESYTVGEIGSLLKIREGTIRMQLMRGRELMKQKLKGGYFNEE